MRLLPCAPHPLRIHIRQQIKLQLASSRSNPYQARVHAASPDTTASLSAAGGVAPGPKSSASAAADVPVGRLLKRPERDGSLTASTSSGAGGSGTSMGNSTSAGRSGASVNGNSSGIRTDTSTSSGSGSGASIGLVSTSSLGSSRGTISAERPDQMDGSGVRRQDGSSGSGRSQPLQQQPLQPQQARQLGQPAKGQPRGELSGGAKWRGGEACNGQLQGPKRLTGQGDALGAGSGMGYDSGGGSGTGRGQSRQSQGPRRATGGGDALGASGTGIGGGSGAGGGQSRQLQGSRRLGAGAEPDVAGLETWKRVVEQQLPTATTETCVVRGRVWGGGEGCRRGFLLSSSCRLPPPRPAW